MKMYMVRKGVWIMRSTMGSAVVSSSFPTAALFAHCNHGGCRWMNKLLIWGE